MEAAQAMTQIEDIPFRDRVLFFVALCFMVVVVLYVAIIETVIIVPGIIWVILKTPSRKPINWDWIYFFTRCFSLQTILMLLIVTFCPKEVIALLP